MGFRSRVFVEGLSVHVTQKGNNGCTIFLRDADYAVFVSMARWASAVANVSVHAFACMSTHYHLLVTPEDRSGLPRMMKRLNGRYVRYFNKTYQRTGTLWNGPYRGSLLDSEIYWLTCLRYIEQNPVKAGIVTSAADYRWSSYPAHAFGQGPEWLAPHTVYYGLGSTPEQRQFAYRALCGVSLTEEQSVLVEEELVRA
jgi:putative transposase